MMKEVGYMSYSCPRCFFKTSESSTLKEHTIEEHKTFYLHICHFCGNMLTEPQKSNKRCKFCYKICQRRVSTWILLYFGIMANIVVYHSNGGDVNIGLHSRIANVVDATDVIGFMNDWSNDSNNLHNDDENRDGEIGSEVIGVELFSRCVNLIFEETKNVGDYLSQGLVNVRRWSYKWSEQNQEEIEFELGSNEVNIGLFYKFFNFIKEFIELSNEERKCPENLEQELTSVRRKTIKSEQNSENDEKDKIDGWIWVLIITYIIYIIYKYLIPILLKYTIII